MVNETYGANPLNIYVHNNDYTQRINLASYIDVEFTEEFGMDAGTGSITLPADHPLVPRLMQCHSDVVPVTAEYNGWRWTGRVTGFEASGTPGREIVRLDLTDDKIQLGSIAAFASTRSGLSVQKRADTQSGPLESVVYHYLSENIARSGLPAYLVMPPKRVNDKSPRINLSARMTPIDALLRDVLNQYDYGVTARMWWPGQPFPEGKIVPLVDGSQSERFRKITHANLDQVFSPTNDPVQQPTQPGLIVSVQKVRERPHVRFTTRSGEIESFKLSGKSPGAARQIVGGKSDDWVNEAIGLGIDFAVQGILTAIGGAALGPIGMIIGGAFGNLVTGQLEDTIFAFTDRTDVESRAHQGPFHLRENFNQSSAGVFTFDTSAIAERALLDAQGGQAVEVVIGHSISKTIGEDMRADNGKIRYGFQVGDRVNFEEHLSGVVVSDIITGITITDTHDKRMRVTPRIGKKKNTSNPFLDFTDRLKNFSSTISDLGLAI